MNERQTKGQRAMYKKLTFKEQLDKRHQLLERMLNAASKQPPERAMLLGMWFEKWRARNFSF